MKRAWNAMLSLMVSAVLVVGLMPAFAVADDGEAAAGDAAVLEEGGEGYDSPEAGEAPGKPAADAEDPAPADGQEAWQEGASGEPQEAPGYADPENPEPGSWSEGEGVAEDAAEEPLDLDQLEAAEEAEPEELLEPEEEADDPEEEEADLESQSDNAKAAYAILYTNGDLVFQRGAKEDPAEGKVRGKWTGFEKSYDSVPWSEMKPHVSSVRFADTISPVSTAEWFSSCYYLTSIDTTNLDTSSVTDMSDMFGGCTSLSSLDVSGFDTSSVTNMGTMFFGCSSLTSLDVSGFDTSSVTNMSEMFDICGSLSSLDLTGLDTSSVTDMSGMFGNCSSLQSLNLTGLDTSSVTNMDDMFWRCSSLESLDLTGLDTSSVTRMMSMFSDCSSLQSLNLTGLDTSSVTYMSYMFDGCSSLVSLDLTGLDTSSVQSMSSMFSDCTSLQSLDLTGLDTSSVRDMDHMFSSCMSLQSLDLTGLDTSSVQDMSYMFEECYFLHSMDLTGIDTSSLRFMSRMFYNCFYLESVDLSGLDASSLWASQEVFVGCPSLTQLNLTGISGAFGAYYLDGVWVDSETGKRIKPNKKKFTAGNWIKTEMLQHAITKNVGEGGKVEIRSGTLYPHAFDEVVLRTVPNAGKTLVRLNVTYTDPATGKNVKLITGKGLVRCAGSGVPGTKAEYRFEMPDCDVTVNATFEDNNHTYVVSKSVTGSGASGSKIMFVGPDGKALSQDAGGGSATMRFKAGREVYFRVVPAGNAELKKLVLTSTYWNLDGWERDVRFTPGHGITDHGGGLYSFTMTCHKATISAVFTK